MARISSPAAVHIGKIITDLRTARHLSIDDLASRTKIDSANIRSYGAGRAMPNVYSLVRIAVALDVEPGELLEGIELSMFNKES